MVHLYSSLPKYELAAQIWTLATSGIAYYKRVCSIRRSLALTVRAHLTWSTRGGNISVIGRMFAPFGCVVVFCVLATGPTKYSANAPSPLFVFAQREVPFKAKRKKKSRKKKASLLQEILSILASPYGQTACCTQVITTLIVSSRATKRFQASTTMRQIIDFWQVFWRWTRKEGNLLGT